MNDNESDDNNGIHVTESINNPSFLTVDNYGVHTNDVFSNSSILNETFSINRQHESYDVQLEKYRTLILNRIKYIKEKSNNNLENDNNYHNVSEYSNSYHIISDETTQSIIR